MRREKNNRRNIANRGDKNDDRHRNHRRLQERQKNPAEIIQPTGARCVGGFFKFYSDLLHGRFDNLGSEWHLFDNDSDDQKRDGSVRKFHISAGAQDGPE